ncbi:ArsR family transcriptional regulator [Saccharothrix yanglingensis]|uniref:ArsR family transcriptional regulator n=1 Tax=Saccharothrix yanglingensis TaxID=659496 RepID=A0ABU0X080_9PSEU|nr:ArsR family transcriptional regulator [Saccharothrix yanglingensis]
MLRIFFDKDDLARVSVASAADPLWEVALAGRRLRDRPPPFRRWERVVRGDLARLGGPAAALVRLLADGPCPVAPSVPAEVVTTLHGVLVAPWAAAVRESVDADRARRAHDLLDGGVHGLLSGFLPHARWEPPVLVVDCAPGGELHLRGRGLRLLPSYFCHGRAVVRDDPAPVLVYPVERLNAVTAVRGDCLDALLGPTRGAVLRGVRSGAGTTELARRLGTSAASVSRHTGVLRAAGLVRTARLGRKTVHSLTALGESLVGRRA